MDNIKVDFEQARARHLLFKTNLRSIVYGIPVDQSPILSEYECGVGKWIYGHALDQYGHIPEMIELEKVHADIHAWARDLLSLFNSGKVKEAREGLPSMEIIADRLIALLLVVEIKINQENPNNEADPTNTSDLNINYKELLDLHRTAHNLDIRIKEEIAISRAAKLLAEENEHKFRNIVTQAPIGIIILKGEDLVVEMANNTYLAIVNRKEEDFIGRSIYIYPYPRPKTKF